MSVSPLIIAPEAARDRQSALARTTDSTPAPATVGAAHAPDPASVAEGVIGSVVALTVAASAAGETTHHPSDNGSDGRMRHAGQLERRGEPSESEFESWFQPDSCAAQGIPFVLDEVSNRQPRQWSNRLFKALNSESPSFLTVDDYARVAEEITRREGDATSSANPSEFREKFRDNVRGRRFELFRNGVLAGYVSYSMRAGMLRLNCTVVPECFDDQGVEGILIHQVLLTAHRRRRATVADSRKTQDFLRLNPQYEQLIHA